MFELSRVMESRHIPVQLAHPAMNSRVPGTNIPNITLEVLDVHGVEADDGREEPDVSFGDIGAEEVGVCVACYVLLDTLERGEERCHGFFVRFLGGCEAGLVHAVVDVVVDPFVCVVDLLA